MLCLAVTASATTRRMKYKRPVAGGTIFFLVFFCFLCSLPYVFRPTESSVIHSQVGESEALTPPNNTFVALYLTPYA